MKEYFKKGKYTKSKIVLAVVISLLLATIYTITRNTFVIDRIFIVGGVIFFASLHGILKLETMYHFIYQYRFSIAGVAFAIIVLMEYSGSSIGVYSGILQGESTDTYFTPVLGKYRSIRSDEWVVNTPIFVSQGMDQDNPYGYHNNNLRGTTTDMFSLVSPAVKDILIVAKPFNIGYLLFGVAKGLSFAWYGKWIALILVAFEFFMLITDKKKVISLCGMILVVFSAATQWWNMTEFMLWGMFALLLLDKYFRTDKVKTKLLTAVGLFLCAVSYIFLLYPAWQLSFGYIYLAIFIGLVIKNRKIYRFRAKVDIPIIAVVIVAIGGIGLRYLAMSQEALQAVLNTDYPGARFELGGRSF